MVVAEAAAASVAAVEVVAAEAVATGGVSLYLSLMPEKAQKPANAAVAISPQGVSVVGSF